MPIVQLRMCGIPYGGSLNIWVFCWEVIIFPHRKFPFLCCDRRHEKNTPIRSKGVHSEFYVWGHSYSPKHSSLAGRYLLTICLRCSFPTVAPVMASAGVFVHRRSAFT